MLGFSEASQDFSAQRNGHYRANDHYFLSHAREKALPLQAQDSEEENILSQVWYNVTETRGFVSKQTNKQTSQRTHAYTHTPGKAQSLNHSAHAWSKQELVCSSLCFLVILGAQQGQQ